MRGGGGEAGGRRSPGKWRVKRQRKLLEIHSGEMPVLFSVVKIPCHAKKMYISILKKRIIPDIFKTS